MCQTTLFISENDPWLGYFDALQLAQAKPTINHLGQVGHINVASGFGPFPDILNYMLPEKTATCNSTSQANFNLKFA